MHRLLGLVLAVLAALALSAGQADANHVHCGDVLTQDTTLDSDLVCSSQPALTVQADNNVTLDLGGHTIRLEREDVGTAITADPYAPSCCREGNVTIENGALDRGGVSMLYPYRPTVRGLTLTGGAGIWLAVSYEAVIEDNEILNGGIDLEVGSGEIRHNIIRDGCGGIQLGQGAYAAITDNVIMGQECVGMGLFRGSGEIAHNRIVDNTGPGINMVLSSGLVHDNVISGNGAGVDTYEANASLRANVITHNSGNGIVAGAPPVGETCLNAENNVISRNGENGVLVGDVPCGLELPVEFDRQHDLREQA
jgi:Right handed beta helix region